MEIQWNYIDQWSQELAVLGSCCEVINSHKISVKLSKNINKRCRWSSNFVEKVYCWRLVLFMYMLVAKWNNSISITIVILRKIRGKHLSDVSEDRHLFSRGVYVDSKTDSLLTMPILLYSLISFYRIVIKGKVGTTSYKEMNEKHRNELNDVYYRGRFYNGDTVKNAKTTYILKKLLRAITYN